MQQTKHFHLMLLQQGFILLISLYHQLHGCGPQQHQPKLRSKNEFSSTTIPSIVNTDLKCIPTLPLNLFNISGFRYSAALPDQRYVNKLKRTMFGLVKQLLPILTNFYILSYENQIFINHCTMDAYDLDFSHYCSFAVYL